MMNFDFPRQTRIVFGENTQKRVGSLLKEYSFNKVLFVYGGGSIKENGLYDDIVASLCEAGVSYLEFSGITANPDVSFVEKGLEIIRKTPVDCILAVGGGSVIDVAKCIAVNYFYDGDAYDFNSHKAVPSKALPISVILTIASSGSESSDSCVINSNKTHEKSGFNSYLVRPLFAIENPYLLKSVPPRQRNAGIVDMMMHSIERYFAQSEPSQLSDEFALSLIKNVKETAYKLLSDSDDIDSLANLMLDSTLAHNGITSIGKKTRFVVHPLEHAMSAYKPEIVHGEGIAVAYLGWAKYVYKEDLEKFAAFARRIFDIKEENDSKAAIMGIEAMRRFYIDLGAPTTLGQLGLHEKDISALSRIATGNGTRVIGCCPRSLNKEDVEAVYRLCL